MTKEQLAAAMNGRGIGNEITKDEEVTAKQEGLVVIFGASDDLCELRGAIKDELGVYKEAMLFIDRTGNLLPEIEDGDTDVLRKYGVLGVVRKLHDQAFKVTANWCKSKEYSWTYETSLPHAEFDIMEGDGEPSDKYCRGIVIDLKELETK